MSFFGNLNTFNSNTQMRVSDIQNYRPGEFLKKYDQQKESGVSYYNPNFPDQTKFKESFIGGLNSYTDDFYKSQVMERTIGGEPVILDAMTHYQPLSADDPQIMDQIRQQHLKIMDQKLQQAVTTNGGNALQQVKTIIVQPLADVVQVTQTGYTQGYQTSARKQILSSVNIMPPLPPNRVSNMSIGTPILRNSRVLQKRSSQVSGGAPQSRSRIQYVPFQRKITQIQTRQRIQKVPRQRVIIEYEDRRIIQQVPVQKTVVDYVAVQHITEYQPKVIEQTIIEMVPVQKVNYTTNYVPIQQQIVHMPGEGRSRIVYQGPPTAQGAQALKNGQSRITYQPPIPQSPINQTNTVISYDNPMIANSIPFQHQRQLTRTPSNKGPIQISTSNLNITPIDVRSQPVFQQSYVDQRYEYQQQPVYVQNSNNISYIPQTQQFQQFYQIAPQVIQYHPIPQYSQNIQQTSQVQYHYPPYTQVIQQVPQVIQYQQYQQPQNIQYAQSSYPAPSQIQTIYQLPSTNVNYIPSQTYTINNIQYPSNNRFVFTQQPLPKEVVQQQKKIIKRQNSGLGITLTK